MLGSGSFRWYPEGGSRPGGHPSFGRLVLHSARGQGMITVLHLTDAVPPDDPTYLPASGTTSMLTIFGRSSGRADSNLSRRGFFQIGALSAFATSLNLADVFRAQATQSPRRHKSVINIFLAGGPPHQDMFDLKPEAPSEVRGEFMPIDTNVPGIQIGETFPHMAKQMDRCAIIRSVVGATGGHDAWQCMTGWAPRDLQVLGGHPSIGAVATKVLGRSIPRCRPSSAWPTRRAMLPGPIRARPAFWDRDTVASSPKVLASTT